MENPYEITQQRIADVAAKPYDLSKVKLARLAWLLPLVCLGISIAINMIAEPLGAIGALIFIGGVIVGFVLSVIGLFMARKHHGILGHAIGGLVANVLLGLAIIGMLHALFLISAPAKKPQVRSVDKKASLLTSDQNHLQRRITRRWTGTVNIVGSRASS